MNEDHQKGMLCGLLAAGLRVEGLLRVALERPETREEVAPQIREAFEIYSAIFRQAWPEAESSVAVATESEADELSDKPDYSVDSSNPDFFDGQAEDCAPAVVAEATPEEISEAVSEATVETIPEVTVEAVPEVIVVEAGQEAPASVARPLADTLKVDELIARKESADLRRAFTLNDKFRFRRTLFGGSDARFSDALDTIEGFSTYKQAESYLAGVIDMECADAEDFMNIINAHFGGKQ
ncbi:MAG: hypothetical protein K2L76_04350 [Muribaculaceae bacterium]|nr:hypothetical protein [Muribaculaceae bacterium]